MIGEFGELAYRNWNVSGEGHPFVTHANGASNRT
jgi:hypothetical protein